MNKMVSMKISKKDRDAKMEPPTLSTDMPLYPWGLSLSLDDDAMEKLGMDIADMKVGSTMSLVATVEVTSCSIQETSGQDANQSVGLQITDMCLEDGARASKNITKALYDNG